MIAFFDASALIYLIESRQPFAKRLGENLTETALNFPELGAAVSRLSWLECRVRPLRENSSEVLASFDEFFARPDLVWIELSRDVVELATVIRVQCGLRTADALQAASCLQLGKDHLFLTGDKSFSRVGGLNVRLLN